MKARPARPGSMAGMGQARRIAAARGVARCARGTAATLSALLLAGCLERDQAVEWRADGGGTLAVDAVLDVAQARRALEVQRKMLADALPAGAADAPEEDAFADLDPARLRADLEGAPGVRLVEATLERSADGARLTQRLRATFTSLEALARSGLLGEMEVRLEALDDPEGAWRLERRLAHEGGALAASTHRVQARARLREQSLKPFRPMLERLALRMRITLPGAVLEVDGQARPKEQAEAPVEWRVGLNDLLDDERLVQRVTFRPPADLALEAFEVTLNDIANEREQRALEREREAEEAR